MEAVSSSESLVPIGEFTGDGNFQSKCKTHRPQKATSVRNDCKLALTLCTTRTIGYNRLTNIDQLASSENSVLLGYGHRVIGFKPFEDKAVVLPVRFKDIWFFLHLKWGQNLMSKRREPIIHWRDVTFRTKKVMLRTWDNIKARTLLYAPKDLYVTCSQWKKNIYLSGFFNSCRRLPETKRQSSLFLHWSGSKFLVVMAACTPSIHVFLGSPLFLLSRGMQSIINFGINF